MREIRPSGSEGGVAQSNAPFLPLYVRCGGIGPARSKRGHLTADVRHRYGRLPQSLQPRCSILAHCTRYSDGSILSVCIFNVFSRLGDNGADVHLCVEVTVFLGVLCRSHCNINWCLGCILSATKEKN